MQLFVENTKAIEVNLITSENIDQKIDQSSFSFDFHLSYSEEQAYFVIFDVKIKTLKFNLTTKYAVKFKCSAPIDSNFKNSDFAQINSPAIAFPMLRSFIATITVNAGYEPLFLPSVNFDKIVREKKNKIDQQDS